MDERGQNIQAFSNTKVMLLPSSSALMVMESSLSSCDGGEIGGHTSTLEDLGEGGESQAEGGVVVASVLLEAFLAETEGTEGDVGGIHSLEGTT